MSERHEIAGSTIFLKARPLLERTTWRHPEWWTVAFSIFAWLLLARTPHRHAEAAWSLTVALGSWSLMIVAMMWPQILGSVRVAAARSLWHRRHRAIVGFLAGYMAVWLAAGVPAIALSAVLGTPAWSPWSLFPAVAIAAAAAWQLTPIKRRAVFACHRTAPLAPSGWTADRDCLRFGWTTGVRCLISCWALMLACVWAGHSLGVMAVASAIGVLERNVPRADQRIVCGVLLGLAATRPLWR